MARVVGIGKQSFEDIRKKDCFYIDKTNFIRDCSNTSMLKYIYRFTEECV